MGFSEAVTIGQDFLIVALMLVGPVVIVSLVVGLTISIAQTVTSIQEQTLSFAPRIVAVVVLLLVTMGWYLQTLQNYTTRLIVEMVDMAVR